MTSGNLGICLWMTQPEAGLDAMKLWRALQLAVQQILNARFAPRVVIIGLNTYVNLICVSVFIHPQNCIKTRFFLMECFLDFWEKMTVTKRKGQGQWTWMHCVSYTTSSDLEMTSWVLWSECCLSHLEIWILITETE